MNRRILDILNRVLEYLDDAEKDPDTPEYLVDKGALLVEDIESLLGSEEVLGDVG